MQQDSIQKQQLIPNNVKYYLFLTEVISDVVGVVVDDYNAGPAILSLSFLLPPSLSVVLLCAQFRVVLVSS